MKHMFLPLWTLLDHFSTMGQCEQLVLIEVLEVLQSLKRLYI
jgi:hypothetical protein